MSIFKGWPPWRRRSSESAFALFLRGEDECAPLGYTRLIDCPAILGAIGRLADVVSNASIGLYRNDESGDERIHNELSRFVDIAPWRWGSRKALIQWIVARMCTDPDGTAYMLPHTENGYLTDLEPMPDAYAVSYDSGRSCVVRWGGLTFAPEDVLIFRLRPDPDHPWRGMGLRASLREVSGNLQQASATRKGFLRTEYKPPLIVSVDSDSEELASEDGRERIRDAYLKDSAAGKPWILPSGMMTVSQVKPLTLNDLAIADNVKIDSRTVATIVGVTPYMVGVGDFNAAEHDSMIRTTATSIAEVITQELTRKLLFAPDLYFKASTRRLYSYNLKDLASVGEGLYVHGLMTGNEVRGWLDMSPKEGLDQLVILENFIPADRIGDQKKLKEGGEN